MGVIGALVESIPAYTGLSATTFFTIMGLVVAVYYLIAAMLAPPPVKYVPRDPRPAPVQIGVVTAEELRQYDGSDPTKPLLMAIKSHIYDVSQSRAFYGPGGPYALFAGRDTSRALAKMSFEEKDLTGDLEGLNATELEALTDWEYRFMSKYVKVGDLKCVDTKGDCQGAKPAETVDVPDAVKLIDHGSS
ncbi:unnamed protein product [Sphagnum balticum]